MDDWRGDLARDFVPLRVLGGVHALVLSGEAPGLATHYPSAGGAPSFPAAWREFLAVIETFEPRLRDGLSSVPQTNEVARSCSLIGGFLRIADRFSHPLRLCELGASAGLNQYCDKHRYQLGDFSWGPEEAALTLRCDWRGGAPALAAPLSVAVRSGCDRAPIDLGEPADRIRLMSYFWPDQVERIERLRRAIDVALADPVKLTRANASDWLAAELEAGLPQNLTTVVFHSSFWSYLDDAEQAAIRRHIERAARMASDEAPLAWLRVEEDGPGVAIELTYWPGGVEERLGTASAHGAWVEWGPPEQPVAG